MTFPLKHYNYEIPTGTHFGAFGVKRKFDIHTGIDLYCKEGDGVIAMEDGEIIAIEWFTGEPVGMPWWNDTKAIGIKGESGVINYGEVIPHEDLKVGDKVVEGQLLGWVTPVLKKDKGKVPSTSMLHVELYTEYDGNWVLWEVGTPQPNNLLDPTTMLQRALIKDDVFIMDFHTNEILNNKIPKIPDVCVNSFLVFHVVNEKIIQNSSDLDYGLMSNITPLWWADLVLYENTNNERYLAEAKKYSKGEKMLVVFYPELLLNLNQQRNIQKILEKLDFHGNIVLKTNSPFIIQTTVGYPTKPRTMVYLGSYKAK
jgi:murein DD-endopeptidase MepM/ murein hydrolase activator NlpD